MTVFVEVVAQPCALGGTLGFRKLGGVAFEFLLCVAQSGNEVAKPRVNLVLPRDVLGFGLIQRSTRVLVRWRINAVHTIGHVRYFKLAVPTIAQLIVTVSG